MREFHETNPAVCRVGRLAGEAATLIVERRGLEDVDPVRWAAIDARLDAIGIEAVRTRAETPEGFFLQSCVATAFVVDRHGRICMAELTRERARALKPLEPLLAYYVGSETDGPPDDRPLPQDR